MEAMGRKSILEGHLDALVQTMSYDNTPIRELKSQTAF